MHFKSTCTANLPQCSVKLSDRVIVISDRSMDFIISAVQRLKCGRVNVFTYFFQCQYQRTVIRLLSLLG